MQLGLMMTSVERMINYTKLPQEPDQRTELDNTLTNWPTNGSIEFYNVHMKYRKELQNTLKGLTVNIKGGEKIGCVGRTGAGKSSIIQVVFRLVELNKEEEKD